MLSMSELGGRFCHGNLERRFLTPVAGVVGVRSCIPFVAWGQRTNFSAPELGLILGWVFNFHLIDMIGQLRGVVAAGLSMLSTFTKGDQIETH